MLICATDGGAPLAGGLVILCCSCAAMIGFGETTSLRPPGGDFMPDTIPGGGAFCSLLVCLCGRPWEVGLAPGDSRGNDSEESLGCGDDLVNSSDVFSPSSMSSSWLLPFRSFRLNRPLSIPFFSLRLRSSLPLPGGDEAFSSESRLGLVLRGYLGSASARSPYLIKGTYLSRVNGSDSQITRVVSKQAWS